MTVAFDSFIGAGTANSPTDLTATLTIANVLDRFAILTGQRMVASGTPTSITLAGQSFSLVSTLAYSTSVDFALYVMYDPPVGTATLVIAQAHATSSNYCLTTYNGVDQSAGYSLQHTSTGSAAAVTATISTRVGDAVLGLFVTGNQGDGSVTCTGSTTQLITRVTSKRIEHHLYDPAGTTQTVAFALVAGNANLRFALNLRATSVAAGASPLPIMLPLTGAGQG